MDFTIKRYSHLLQSLLARGFLFVRVNEYVKTTQSINFSKTTATQLTKNTRENADERITIAKRVILRHDVDARPHNALNIAQLEHSLGIKGSYYFRMVPECFDTEIIRRIASMGHEIGYHYETLVTVMDEGKKGLGDFGTKKRRENDTERLRGKKTMRLKDKKAEIQGEWNKIVNSAYALFVENLSKLRETVPVTTICMHGSPLSYYDNRAIWEKYDYHDLGIICDPYFDLDFSKIAYFTDTGRRWNGSEVSIRDKVDSPFRFNLKTTNDLISAIPQFPDTIMLTIHPQRWNDQWGPWAQELIWQNFKNPLKQILIKWRREPK